MKAPVRALYTDQQPSSSTGAAAAPARKQLQRPQPRLAPQPQANEAVTTKPLLWIKKKLLIRKTGSSQSPSSATAPLPDSSTADVPSGQLVNPRFQCGYRPFSQGASSKRSLFTKPLQPASPLAASPSLPTKETRTLSRQERVPPGAGVVDGGSTPTAAAALTNSGPSRKAWVPPLHTHESPDHLPTDEPNVLLPAHKYVYDVTTCTWKGVDTMIRVLHPNRGLSQGAMRVCFALQEVDERGFSTDMVAKMFRHRIPKVMEGDYFSEGEAQCICGIFAEKFNRLPVPKGFHRHVISFLQCETVRIKRRETPEAYANKRSGFFSYHPTDSADILFSMEPRLEGNFTKYTSNFGEVYEGFERRLSTKEEKERHRVLMAVEAFSHFTLVESGGSMLVCDLQGVNDFLTDPQIHTEDGKGLGMGNMGQEGIDKWMEAHTCNDVCKAVQLKPLSKGPRSCRRTVGNDSRVSYHHILRAKLRSHAPVRPEDIIPPTKPLSAMTDNERLEYAVRLSALLSD
ncbi:hypothetical protein GH5_08555 [Leishmania sp. Ghana 2012 LV757]|uniref:uncharacterized protein n=1 Tax=Leishmania sp. Ghana 2012 LV757 TaxID=2803181 RepID=UPI001B7499C6|nr:hypothetical protein GH5_08555 [Leishmania sp. Ghana 2012 LV757]